MLSTCLLGLKETRNVLWWCPLNVNCLKENFTWEMHVQWSCLPSPDVGKYSVLNELDIRQQQKIKITSIHPFYLVSKKVHDYKACIKTIRKSLLVCSIKLFILSHDFHFSLQECLLVNALHEAVLFFSARLHVNEFHKVKFSIVNYRCSFILPHHTAVTEAALHYTPE